MTNCQQKKIAMPVKSPPGHMPGEFRQMIAALGFRLIDNMAQGQFVSTNSLFMKCALQTSLDLYYRRQLFYGILYCRFQLFDCFVLSCLF